MKIWLKSESHKIPDLDIETELLSSPITQSLDEDNIPTSTIQPIDHPESSSLPVTMYVEKSNDQGKVYYEDAKTGKKIPNNLVHLCEYEDRGCPFIGSYDEVLKHDLWWDAEKCLNHGLIDEIL